MALCLHHQYINESHQPGGTSLTIQAQKYISNESTRKNFMSFYRCVKTLNLLHNLYLA